VLNSWCTLSTFDYLFHKLFEEKLWKSKKMPYYAFYILLNSIMQEKSDQDMNQWKKHNKGEKNEMSPEQQMSPWRERRNREHVFGKESSPERHMSPWREEEFQNPCFLRPEFAMARIVLPGKIWRYGANGWWRGRNPLAKKGPVAIAIIFYLARK